MPCMQMGSDFSPFTQWPPSNKWWLRADEVLQSLKLPTLLYIVLISESKENQNKTGGSFGSSDKGLSRQVYQRVFIRG